MDLERLRKYACNLLDETLVFDEKSDVKLPREWLRKGVAYDPEHGEIEKDIDILGEGEVVREWRAYKKLLPVKRGTIVWGDILSETCEDFRVFVRYASETEARKMRAIFPVLASLPEQKWVLTGSMVGAIDVLCRIAQERVRAALAVSKLEMEHTQNRALRMQLGRCRDDLFDGLCLQLERLYRGASVDMPPRPHDMLRAWATIAQDASRNTELREIGAVLAKLVPAEWAEFEKPLLDIKPAELAAFSILLNPIEDRKVDFHADAFAERLRTIIGNAATALENRDTARERKASEERKACANIWACVHAVDLLTPLQDAHLTFSRDLDLAAAHNAPLLTQHALWPRSFGFSAASPLCTLHSECALLTQITVVHWNAVVYKIRNPS